MDMYFKKSEQAKGKLVITKEFDRDSSTAYQLTYVYNLYSQFELDVATLLIKNGFSDSNYISTQVLAPNNIDADNELDLNDFLLDRFDFDLDKIIEYYGVGYEFYEVKKSVYAIHKDDNVNKEKFLHLSHPTNYDEEISKVQPAYAVMLAYKTGIDFIDYEEVMADISPHNKSIKVKDSQIEETILKREILNIGYLPKEPIIILNTDTKEITFPKPKDEQSRRSNKLLELLLNMGFTIEGVLFELYGNSSIYEMRCYSYFEYLYWTFDLPADD